MSEILRVMVADDDEAIARTVVLGLKTLGCAARSAPDGKTALEGMDGEPADVLLTDMRMGGMSGVELVRETLARHPDTVCVVMTAFASYENAVEAIKAGAFDYLPKPFSVDQLEHLIRKVSTVVDLRRENRRLRKAVTTAEEGVEAWFRGVTSPVMLDLQRLVGKLANGEASVLFTGETGTGKTSLARALHRDSGRAAGPFVEVTCTTLAESLFESEVFGHVRGAFTGAVRDRAGKFESADGGTLFLDEIGELSLSSQAKLLRFLEDRVIERVGDNKPLRLNVRVLAATNRDLAVMVREGRFREDLYYRLNVFECRIPPLRERRGDIEPLARRLLLRAVEYGEKGQAGERKPPVLSEPVREALLAHDWPGNTRELRNVMDRLALLAAGREATPADLPPAFLPSADGAPETEAADFGVGHGRILTLRELEERHIRRVLGLGVSLERAAELLGVTGVTLWRKRKELGLP